jgi:hypothetical protein
VDGSVAAGHGGWLPHWASASGTVPVMLASGGSEPAGRRALSDLPASLASAAHDGDAYSLMDAQDTKTPDLTPAERRTLLVAAYQEVCRSHAGITDFRAKLLALLPIASGTGIGLLVIQGDGVLSTTGAGLLVALGIFGALVTLGLFLYELRQIDVCKQLRNHAAWIEQQLGIDAGQFGGRRERLSLRDVYSRAAHKERDKQLEKAETSGQRVESEEPEAGLDRKPFIGAETAGYLVYHTVLGAWLFVTVLGIAKLI